MFGRRRERRAGGAGAVPVPPRWEWPTRIDGRTPTGVDLVLRPLLTSDAEVFQSVRRANAAWLEPWDATSPDDDAPPKGFAELVAQYDADAAAGRALPLVIEVDGRLVGQVNVGTIVLGSFRSCSVGYWVSRAMAGRMVTPTAVALVGDRLMQRHGLHRVEINVRPENEASFRDEGLRRHYLHIAGAWRDHRSFALTLEDLAGETLAERLARRAAAPEVR